jgi:hypothetical protein
VRLLEAEQHQVRLSYGRQALHALEETRAAPVAVLLIWSADAPAQHYMLEWAHAIGPERLVEIARAKGAPRLPHHAPVIDFSTWRGERGGRAWNTLAERLRSVERVVQPPKAPPKQAIAAMGLASIAAMAGAVMVRTQAPDAVAPEGGADFVQIEEVAIGGALEALEPPSVEDLELDAPLQPVRFTQHPAAELEGPQYLAGVELPELRSPTLLERLSDLNPLRGRS